MADINNIMNDYEKIANNVLYITQKENVILQHLNMDYQDEIAVTSPVGVLNQTLKIIVVDPSLSSPADIFEDEIKISAYNEGDNTLVLDKPIDKSNSFGLKNSSFAPGAVLRATQQRGRDIKDRLEIEALKIMFAIATPIILPNGRLKDQTDFAALEMFANDRNIAAENSVVLLSSRGRSHMTETTTLFAYSVNKEQKFSYGLGANTNFANGNGYITTEFGLNFFLSEKLSDSYKYKDAFRPKDVASDATLVYTGGAKASVGLSLDGKKVESLLITFPAKDAVEIPARSILKINGKYVQLGNTSYKQEAVSGSTATKIWAIDGSYLSDLSQFSYPEDDNVDFDVVELSKSRGFDSLLFSNKALAFACKAPAIQDESSQMIINDPTTGIAMRESVSYEIKTKETIYSTDLFAGFLAVLPSQFAKFQG